MGKRELLLAAAFIILGIAVYQFTAPPSDQSRPGWSFSGMVQKMRREVSGNRASAKATTTYTAPASAALREVRIVMRSGAITVIGEDREDIKVDLTATSSGYDDAEADRLAKSTKVKLDEAGAMLIATVDYPREGRQTATMEVHLPRRIGVRIDEKSGVLKINDVASVMIGSGRGETNIANIPGLVQVTQRGSVITIDTAGSLKLTTFSGADARINKVLGDATLALQGGELRAEGIAGAIDVESRNTEVRFEKLAKTGKPLRINATSGEVTLAGVQDETRIDGRGTDIRVDQTLASTLSIYNDGSESIELTVPPNGFKLDAVAVDGRLTVDSALEKAGVAVTGSNTTGGEAGARREEYRVTANVRGGGPLVTIRSVRGDIVLRSR
jgi:hypothetical protein